MSSQLTLISHHLCPYVQRAVIALTEKQVAFDRIDIDLGDKPDWFVQLSPLGKTPVLTVGDTPIFESNVILEYLEETHGMPLHPSDPLKRAEHRGWMAFGSAILDDIAGFYNAPDKAFFAARQTALRSKISRIEARIADGPYFAGDRFSLVDAVFGPVFRYFDIFDAIGDFAIFKDKPKTLAWRRSLMSRASVRDAVARTYDRRLMQFLHDRDSYLSTLMQG